ncbi:hypothetical protein CALCODRAFT_526844, partial [Calocera cornea HHB12733]
MPDSVEDLPPRSSPFWSCPSASPIEEYDGDGFNGGAYIDGAVQPPEYKKRTTHSLSENARAITRGAELALSRVDQGSGASTSRAGPAPSGSAGSSTETPRYIHQTYAMDSVHRILVVPTGQEPRKLHLDELEEAVLSKQDELRAKELALEKIRVNRDQIHDEQRKKLRVEFAALGVSQVDFEKHKEKEMKLIQDERKRLELERERVRSLTRTTISHPTSAATSDHTPKLPLPGSSNEDDQSANAQYLENVKRMDEVRAQLQAECKRLKNELEVMRNTLAETHGQLASANDRATLAHERMTTAIQDRGDAVVAAEALRKDKMSVDNALEASNRLVAQLKDEIRESIRAKGLSETSIRRLTAELDKTKRELATVRDAAVSRPLQNAAGITSEVSRGLKGVFHRAATTDCSDCQVLTAKVEQLSREMDNANSQLATYENNITTLQTSKAELEGRYQKITAELTTVSINLEATSNDNTEIRAALAVKTASADALSAELMRMKDKFQRAREKNRRLIEEVDSRENAGPAQDEAAAQQEDTSGRAQTPSCNESNGNNTIASPSCPTRKGRPLRRFCCDLLISTYREYVAEGVTDLAPHQIPATQIEDPILADRMIDFRKPKTCPRNAAIKKAVVQKVYSAIR